MFSHSNANRGFQKVMHILFFGVQGNLPNFDCCLVRTTEFIQNLGNISLPSVSKHPYNTIKAYLNSYFSASVQNEFVGNKHLCEISKVFSSKAKGKSLETKQKNSSTEESVIFVLTLNQRNQMCNKYHGTFISLTQILNAYKQTRHV